MNADSPETTLSLALEKTRGGRLKWEKGGGKDRYVVDVGSHRLRIESVRARGEHPFKFSIVKKGGGGPEQAVVTSAEAGEQLQPDQTQRNQQLRELWELSAEQSRPSFDDLNKLLDKL